VQIVAARLVAQVSTVGRGVQGSWSLTLSAAARQLPPNDWQRVSQLLPAVATPIRQLVSVSAHRVNPAAAP